MAGKPQPPRQHCKQGHPLTADNLEPHLLRLGRRRCLICARDCTKDWKTKRRRIDGVAPKGEKPICTKGHPRTLNNLRPGRLDCAICHRERATQRARKRGVPPMIRRTRLEKLAQRRMWQSAREARKKAAFIEHVDPRIVFSRDQGICGICRIATDPLKYEVDHIIPLSRGGTHGYANVQLAHPLCNRKKWAN